MKIMKRSCLIEQGFSHSLSTRYASEDLKLLFSDQVKLSTWRRLWTWMARAQQELGFDMTDEQITEMEANIEKIDFTETAENEKSSHLDMMAQAQVFAKYCPNAAPLIYLGTTREYGGDFTDTIILYEALELILLRIATVIKVLSELALTYKDFPIFGKICTFGLSETVELTTVGKQFCSWIKCLSQDESYFRSYRKDMRFSSIVGWPRIQDSLLKIFDGDNSKIEQFDLRVRKFADFDFTSRGYDDYNHHNILKALVRFGLNVKKIFKDFSKLVLLREFDEPSETTLNGSSEMSGSYCCCALADHMKMLDSYAQAENRRSVLWMEEVTHVNTINRSLFVPESLLCADTCLLTLLNISQGLIVYPKVIKRHVDEELPFIVAEDIIMAMRIAGRPTQHCLEKIRSIAQKAIAHDDGDNLLERFKADPYFEPIFDQMDYILDTKRFTNIFADQVEEYVAYTAHPIIAKYGLEIKNLPVNPKTLTSRVTLGFFNFYSNNYQSLSMFSRYPYTFQPNPTWY